jgi:hypothetical protein
MWLCFTTIALDTTRFSQKRKGREGKGGLVGLDLGVFQALDDRTKRDDDNSREQVARDSSTADRPSASASLRFY